jgi:Cu/Ag efflux protein CusF
MSIENVKINPMYVYLGKDQAQIEKITCNPDVAGSLGGKYFVFSTSAGVKHYAWFNTGSSVDPAPAGGWTGHSVTISSGSTASQVASALQAVLDVVTGFDASVSGYVVTLTHTATGFAEQARDVDTGFAFKVTQLGMSEQSAGCIQGDIEISGFEQNKVEITCHASGTTVKDERISGYGKPQITMTFQETDKASLQNIFVMYGMPVFTPIGSDKSAVFGYGPANVGGSNPKIPVRLHPVALDSSDKSEDWNIWTAELGLDTLNFSGENVSTVPATFTIYPDSNKPAGIQFFMVGDAAKAGY